MLLTGDHRNMYLAQIHADPPVVSEICGKIYQQVGQDGFYNRFWLPKTYPVNRNLQLTTILELFRKVEKVDQGGSATAPLVD